MSTESGFILEVREGERIVYSDNKDELKRLTHKGCNCSACNHYLSDFWYEEILAITDDMGQRIGRMPDLTDGFYMVYFGYGSFGDKVYWFKKIYDGNWLDAQGSCEDTIQGEGRKHEA